MQSYISHRRGRVFNPLILFFFFVNTCVIDLLRKILEIIEKMIFSLIFILRKIWYFRQMRQITKIWYSRSTFLQKCCFSCSGRHLIKLYFVCSEPPNKKSSSNSVLQSLESVLSSWLQILLKKILLKSNACENKIMRFGLIQNLDHNTCFTLLTFHIFQTFFSL